MPRVAGKKKNILIKNSDGYRRRREKTDCLQQKPTAITKESEQAANHLLLIGTYRYAAKQLSPRHTRPCTLLRNRFFKTQHFTHFTPSSNDCPSAVSHMLGLP